MSEQTYKRIKDITGEPATDIENQFFAIDSENKGTQKVVLSDILNTKLGVIQYEQTMTEPGTTIGKFVDKDGHETAVIVPYENPAAFDGSLNNESENAPQNKVVKAAIDSVNSDIATKMNIAENQAKLNSIAEGAQVNVIETINGQAPSQGSTDLDFKEVATNSAIYVGTVSVSSETKTITATTLLEGQFMGQFGDIIYIILGIDPTESPLTLASISTSPIRVIIDESDFIILNNGSSDFEVTWVTNQIIQLVYNGSQFNLLGQNKATTSTWGETMLLSDITTDVNNSTANREDVAVTPKYVADTVDKYVKEDDWFDKVYPIGSIYLSLINKDPGELFDVDSTWVKIKDKFLLADGTTYDAFDEGGSPNAIVPVHNHSISQQSIDIKYSTIGTTSNPNRDPYHSAGTGVKHLTLPAHNTNNTGESAEGKNMPPYLVVYMWVRVESGYDNYASLKTYESEESEG